MNNKELEQLFKLLKDTDIYELELERSNGKLKIKRGEKTPHIISAPVDAHIHNTYAQNTGVVKPDEKMEAEKNENVKYIVSSMVGTFYRAPSPEAQPYVEKGDEITKGQILCIIEAMKLFNEIESDISGKVVDILVENGKPVEYGEKLFAIEELA